MSGTYGDAVVQLFDANRVGVSHQQRSMALLQQIPQSLMLEIQTELMQLPEVFELGTKIVSSKKASDFLAAMRESELLMLPLMEKAMARADIAPEVKALLSEYISASNAMKPYGEQTLQAIRRMEALGGKFPLGEFNGVTRTVGGGIQELGVLAMQSVETPEKGIEAVRKTLRSAHVGTLESVVSGAGKILGNFEVFKSSLAGLTTQFQSVQEMYAAHKTAGDFPFADIMDVSKLGSEQIRVEFQRVHELAASNKELAPLRNALQAMYEDAARLEKGMARLMSKVEQAAAGSKALTIYNPESAQDFVSRLAREAKERGGAAGTPGKEAKEATGMMKWIGEHKVTTGVVAAAALGTAAFALANMNGEKSGPETGIRK